MKMVVKFLVNDCSVTNSSFFFASRPFLVLFGDMGETGEPPYDPALPFVNL